MYNFLSEAEGEFEVEEDQLEELEQEEDADEGEVEETQEAENLVEAYGGAGPRNYKRHPPSEERHKVGIGVITHCHIHH